MKKYLENPLFYYILVPVIAGIWAIAAAVIFYPRAVVALQESKEEYTATQELLAQIVAIEPQRLAYQKEKGSGGSGDFDFTRVINEFATLFSIPSADFTLNTRGETRRAGKRAQSAVLAIKTIDIEKRTKFLSGRLVRWPELQCETLNLEKIAPGKNNWKAEMTLTYYF